MMGLHQAVEARLRRGPADLGDRERPQLAQAPAQRRAIDRDDLRPRARQERIRRPPPYRRQLDMPRAPQRQHQAPAHHLARRAIRLAPAPGVTQRLRQRPPALLRVSSDEFADLMHVVPRDGTAAVAQQHFHG
jgi:hypothetical protein